MEVPYYWTSWTQRKDLVDPWDTVRTFLARPSETQLARNLSSFDDLAGEFLRWIMHSKCARHWANTACHREMDQVLGNAVFEPLFSLFR